MKTIDILADRIDEAAKGLYISTESLKRISELAKSARETNRQFVDFRKECNGFCDVSLVTALCRKAKNIAENPEYTPKERLEILEQLLGVKHEVKNIAFRGASTRHIDGFDDATRQRFLRVFAKTPGILANNVMHKGGISPVMKWLENREREIAEQEKKEA